VKVLQTVLKGWLLFDTLYSTYNLPREAGFVDPGQAVVSGHS